LRRFEFNKERLKVRLPTLNAMSWPHEASWELFSCVPSILQ
jgi:hypothetical protein